MHRQGVGTKAMELGAAKGGTPKKNACARRVIKCRKERWGRGGGTSGGRMGHSGNSVESKGKGKNAKKTVYSKKRGSPTKGPRENLDPKLNDAFGWKRKEDRQSKICFKPK